MNDVEFLGALENGSLPADAFTHRNHLRAAWLYLEQHPLPEAAMRCALAIQRYATGLGAAEKFHLTLTLAFMHLIAEGRRQYPAANWETFLERYPELVTDAKTIINRHYSDELLASDRARRTYLPPDRAPLPSGE